MPVKKKSKSRTRKTNPYRKCRDVKKDVEKSICTICFEELGKHRKIASIDSCQHQFCRKCILKWSESNKACTCPLCRKTFTSVKTDKSIKKFPQICGEVTDFMRSIFGYFTIDEDLKVTLIVWIFDEDGGHLRELNEEELSSTGFNGIFALSSSRSHIDMTEGNVESVFTVRDVFALICDFETRDRQCYYATHGVIDRNEDFFMGLLKRRGNDSTYFVGKTRSPS